ncbi:MAG: PAS domain-containing protein [Methylocystis sp.]|uniref:PAS domain-containing protein n=1 Tax=Methylocystis sp. TaxID=1911079 RepID=UPI003DA40212
MKQLVSKELYDYWNSLKGARLAPERNDIDLASIRHLLANVFILQIDRSGRYPLEMCGTRINAFRLADQKGRSFLEFWDEQDRDAIVAAISAVTDEARPVVVGARSGAGDLSRLDAELLLLPLRHSGKTHSLALGALTPAHEPEWLGRKTAPALHVSSLRVLDGRDASFAGRSARTASRPRLVLHEGGKSACFGA